jgi:hypothetical protein
MVLSSSGEPTSPVSYGKPEANPDDREQHHTKAPTCCIEHYLADYQREQEGENPLPWWATRGILRSLPLCFLFNHV